jgi:WW domain
MWTKQYSKKNQREYYFNTETGESRWEPPQDWVQEGPGQQPTEENGVSERRKRSEELTGEHEGHNAKIEEYEETKAAEVPVGGTEVQEAKRRRTDSVCIIVPFRDLHPEQHRSEQLHRFYPALSM